jgi:hypothetical protein
MEKLAQKPRPKTAPEPEPLELETEFDIDLDEEVGRKVGRSARGREVER